MSREVGGGGSREGLMFLNLLVISHASVLSTSFGNNDL